LTNSLLRASAACQADIDADADGLVSFGKQDGIQTEALRTGTSQVMAAQK
jgi:hypothetical protein